MQLKTLLEDVDYQLVQGNVEQEISALIYDSRKAAPGAVFVCICGAVRDGHDFAAEVTQNGCPVLIVQRDVDVAEDVTSGKRADNDRYHRHQGKDNSDLYGTFHS